MTVLFTTDTLYFNEWWSDYIDHKSNFEAMNERVCQDAVILMSSLFIIGLKRD